MIIWIISNFLYWLKYWLFAELINWFKYLYIYVNLIEPKFQKFKSIDTIKIINRIEKLTKDEIEYVIAGCVVYDKETHTNITISPEQIKTMSRTEIIKLIGYSLFGLNIDNIEHSSEKISMIESLINKIQIKLNYKFDNSNTDRYLYRKWGNNFIKFNFRPLFIHLPLKIIIWITHLYFTLNLKFNWELDNKIGFLYKKNPDPNKKYLLFIHGIGFGYIPYICTLMELNKKYNLIILVLPNISSYNNYDNIDNSYFPPLDNISSTLANFLNKKNIQNPILLAHSFGTYIAQIIRKNYNQPQFEKIILVDPIIFWIGCFKMSLHVDNPFIKKYPLANYIIDNFCSFVIYQCIYLKYVLYRVMFGPDFWIYDSTELIGSNVIIVLEKNDYIIPADIIYDKIKNDVKCYYLESDMTHGTILMDSKYFNDLLYILEN